MGLFGKKKKISQVEKVTTPVDTTQYICNGYDPTICDVKRPGCKHKAPHSNCEYAGCTIVESAKCKKV
jgi:hypothetical protein